MVSSKARRRVRHVLIRYRRPLAAACAFTSVLFTIAALRPAGSDEALPLGNPTTAEGAASWQTELRSDLVAAPVRLADADVASLIRPGSVVDVLAADSRGHAQVVAQSATVIDVPDSDSGPLSSSSFAGALVVVAVPSAVATELAGAAAQGPLSLVVHG